MQSRQREYNQAAGLPLPDEQQTNVSQSSSTGGRQSQSGPALKDIARLADTGPRSTASRNQSIKLWAQSHVPSANSLPVPSDQTTASHGIDGNDDMSMSAGALPDLQADPTVGQSTPFARGLKDNSAQTPEAQQRKSSLSSAGKVPVIELPRTIDNTMEHSRISNRNGTFVVEAPSDARHQTPASGKSKGKAKAKQVVSPPARSSVAQNAITESSSTARTTDQSIQSTAKSSTSTKRIHRSSVEKANEQLRLE